MSTAPPQATPPTPAQPAKRSVLTRRISWGWLVLVVFVVVVLWTFTNPRANVPVISPIVCSVKGGTWTDGSPAWGIAAGCYETP